MIEEWRPIPGVTKNYQVSNLGRVRSMPRGIVRANGWPQTVRLRILKHGVDEWGYPMVRVDQKTCKVHRLVAAAFLGLPQPGEVVRHLDGNPQNNRVENLCYGSASENVLDGYSYRGKIRRDQKLTPAAVLDIRQRVSAGEPSRGIARVFGVSEQTVCDIKHRRIYAWLDEERTGGVKNEQTCLSR